MLLPPFHDLHHKTFDLIQDGHLNVHFSQWGEDIVLWHFLRERRNGFYVDVGAHHPQYLSNTALLYYYNEWSGINVEPDNRLIQEFVKARPRDTNICCGVGAANGVAKMGVFDDGSVNSFDPGSVDLMVAHGRTLLEWREVPIRTLSDIIEEHLPLGRSVDMLNVDVEGWDMIVLKSNDWTRHRPEFILVEDHKMYLPKLAENEIHMFLVALGYRLLSQVLATSIYKRDA